MTLIFIWNIPTFVCLFGSRAKLTPSAPCNLQHEWEKVKERFSASGFSPAGGKETPLPQRTHGGIVARVQAPITETAALTGVKSMAVPGLDYVQQRLRRLLEGKRMRQDRIA